MGIISTESQRMLGDQLINHMSPRASPEFLVAEMMEEAEVNWYQSFLFFL